MSNKHHTRTFLALVLSIWGLALFLLQDSGDIVTTTELPTFVPLTTNEAPAIINEAPHINYQPELPSDKAAFSADQTIQEPIVVALNSTPSATLFPTLDTPSIIETPIAKTPLVTIQTIDETSRNRPSSGESSTLSISRDVSAQDAPICTTTQLTDTTGGWGSRHPSITADGTRILFLSNKDLAGNNTDGNDELFLWDQYEGLIQLTDTIGPGNEFGHAISDNGDWAVLASSHDFAPWGEIGGGIYVMNLASWASPDFSFIIGVSHDLPNQLQIYGASNGFQDLRVVFSATDDLDEEVGNSDGNFEIFMYEYGEVRQITDTPNLPDFSIGAFANSDLTRLAFASYADITGDNADGNREVFLWDGPTNTISQVTDTAWDEYNIWSEPSGFNSSGDVLVISSSANLTGSNSDENPEIFVWDEINGFTQITNIISDDGSWVGNISDDGSIIVFSSYTDLVGNNADGSVDIFMWKQGDGIYQLTDALWNINEDFSIFGPVTNSDTRRIAFTTRFDLVGANSDNNSELFLITCDQPPQITAPPVNQTIGTNGIADLYVEAIGNFPLTIQWYQGNSGDTSNPVGTSAQFTTPNLFATTSYWVRVSNAAGTADSDTATITVLPPSSVTCEITQIFNGSEGELDNSQAFISADGSRVVFLTSENYLGGNPDEGREIFLWDETDGITQITNTPTQSEGSFLASLSSDGTRIAFTSSANFAGSNADGSYEIFLWDETDGFTQITISSYPASYSNVQISGDGQHILFAKVGDSSGSPGSAGFYLWEEGTGFIRISDNVTIAGQVWTEAVDTDGTRVAFASTLDFTGNNTDHNAEVFYWDRLSDTFTQITYTVGDLVFNQRPRIDISDDGSRILFMSHANLLGGPDTEYTDIYLWIEGIGVSRLTQSSQQNNRVSFMSGDGTRAVFVSTANLFGNDPDPYSGDPILWDTATGYTQILTGTWGTYDFSLNADGSRIAFPGYNDTGTEIIRGYFIADCAGPLSPIIAPSDLTATTISDTQIDLEWTDNSSDETGFRIEQSPDGINDWIEIDTTAANVTTYINIGLTCNTAYHYRVRAYRSGDDAYSDYSNSATTTTDVCLPNPPTSLTATPLSHVEMQLTWADNSTDETNFDIQQSADGVNNWKSVKSVDNNTTSTTLSANCDTTTHYRIRAYRAADEQYSDFSDATSATTPACSAPVQHTVGIYKDGVWQFRNDFNTGPSDVSFLFGPKQSGWTPIAGDWDGDGVDGIGLYKDGAFLLRDTATGGPQDVSFRFGPTENGWMPIVGDWNGDDVDSVGLYKNGVFMLTDENITGAPDYTFTYGLTQAGYLPIAGDWDGGGSDSVGLYKAGAFHLTNSLTSGPLKKGFYFGPNTGNWLPLSGDWNADGTDTIGVYREGVWRLINSNTANAPDEGFTFGQAGGWKPIIIHRGDVSGMSLLSALSMDLTVPTEEPSPMPDATLMPEATAEPTLEPTSETTPEMTLMATATPTDISPTETPAETATELTPTETPTLIETPAEPAPETTTEAGE